MAILSGTNFDDANLQGTLDDDQISGLDGNDTLYGLVGNDVLLGGLGNDVLDGGAGADQMTGGAGADTYFVDNIGDVIVEDWSAGVDTVYSSISHTMAANVDKMFLTGSAVSGIGNTLNNTIFGTAGDNILDGGSGSDTLYGGAGNDIYYVSWGFELVIEAANQGTDLIRADVSHSLNNSNEVENLELIGTANINATGNWLNNTLLGTSGANVINGGTGADFMAGGNGNDTYVVDNLGDSVSELAGANSGVDRVQSAVSYTLQANVENLTLTGITATQAIGNSGNNILTGNSANNQLDGGAGNDTMAGGTGDDIYLVDSSQDLVVEALNAGNDTVIVAVDYTLGLHQENLTLSGNAALRGTGNATANVIVGNGASNLLGGGGGADTLRGEAGNDILIYDPAAITLDGGVGTDTLRVTGSGLVLDLATLNNVSSIERIDLGSGGNSLQIDEIALRALSDLDSLVIDGGLNSRLTMNGGWNFVGDVGAYGRYSLGTATLDVSHTVSIGAAQANSAPLLNLCSAQQINEGTALVFSTANGNALSTGDAQGDALTAVLLAANGTLTLAQITGLTAVSGNGGSALTITGSSSAINAALDGLRYTPSSNYFGTAQISFDLTDSQLSTVGSVNVTVNAINDAPLMTTAGGTAAYTEGGVAMAASSAITLADVDSTTLASASVVIRGFVAGDILTTTTAGTAISASYNALSGVLALSGVDTLANYQQVLNAVRFASTSFNPTNGGASAVRNFDWSVNDGATVNAQSSVATSTVNVTAVNNAPLNTVPGAQTVAEDTALSLSGTKALSVTDLDAGTQPVTVSLAVANGTLSLGATSGLSGDLNGADGNLALVGTLANINAALNGLVYRGLANYNGADTLTFTSNDGGAGGGTLGLQDSDSVAISITPMNDAPVLDASKSPSLANVTGNSPAPSGAVGTLVSALLDLPGGGGLDNVTDGDGGTVGVALTALNATSGTWWFSLNNGSSWSTVGAVSETSALLVSGSSGRLYFQPNSGFSGTLANAITFRAWDLSSGTNGSKVTTAGAGSGTSAFSSASDTASEVVSSVVSVLDTIAISTLNGTAGLKLNGVRGSASPGFNDRAGSSVAGIGDVNGDGRADLLVGAQDAEFLTDSLALNRGRSYVVFGDSTAKLATLANGTTGFNLNLLNGSQGVTLSGPSEINGGFSYKLAGGGDHNGDGIADLLASQQSGSGASSRGYVVYGDSPSNGTLSNGFGGLHTLVAAQLAGSNTSGVNDVNADGVDDGAVFDGLDGRFQGLAIGNAGDIDNDGLDDIIVGNAERDTARGTDSGESFVVFGNSRAALDGLAPLGGSNGTNVLSLQGQAASDTAGFAVSGIGDINHDGFEDFAIGATMAGVDGKFYVVLGDMRTNLNTLASSINASGFNTALNGTNGFRSINSPFAQFANPAVGQQITRLGDFNGDLIDDFVVSAGAGGLGMALVVFGKTSAFSATLDLSTLMSTHVGGFAIAAGVTDIAGAGDVNGDGLADLVIGASGSNQAYILFGTSTITPLLRVPDALGQAVVDLTDNVSLSGSGVNLQSGGYLHGKGVVLNGTASTNFGASVTGVGDFNGDGFDDVMVGAPLATTSTSIGNPAGAAFVVYGADFALAGTAAVNATVTAAGQVLRGGAGADHLSSGGFANVGITAGAGADVVRVHGNEFGVNGGSGIDVLTPDTNNLTLNFDGLTNKNLYANLEQIQLDGFGTNTVQLDLRDVLDMSGLLNELVITGDNGVDSVLSTGQGWSGAGSTVRTVFIDDTRSSASLTFNVYSHGSDHVSLLVEQSLIQTIS